METDGREIFNSYIESGTVVCCLLLLCSPPKKRLSLTNILQLKNYAHVLEIILRLRQICCHPNLLTRNRNEKEISELMKNRENLDEETAQKLLSTLADKANEVLLAANCIYNIYCNF